MKRHLATVLVCAAFMGSAAAQQMPSAGTTVWGQDGRLYQSNGQQWQTTQLQRRFPGSNQHEYDVYENGRLVRRLNIATPGQITEYNYISKVWVRYPVQGQNANNTFSLYQGKWISQTQLMALIQQTISAIHQEKARQHSQAIQHSDAYFVIGGPSQQARVPSSSSSNEPFVIGGAGSGYKLDTPGAQLRAQMGINDARAANARVWVAPTCTSGSWCR